MTLWDVGERGLTCSLATLISIFHEENETEKPLCIIRNSVLNMSAWRLASNLFVTKHANTHDLVVLDKVTINKVQNILNSKRDGLPEHEVHLVKKTIDLFSIGSEQMFFEVVIQMQVSRKVGMHKPCNGRQKEKQCPSTTRKKQQSSTYKFLING